MDLMILAEPAALAALFEILMIDIMLAGDNAIVVGALAAGLPPDQRRKVIMIGVAAALVLRIAFALVVSQLMGIVGLILAGGLLLLWVAWRMIRELRHGRGAAGEGKEAAARPPRSFASAAWGIAIADISMSLDNVLGVAGAARNHPQALVFGFILSVVLMGIASSLIARLIERHRWIAWLGIAVILWVAGKMIHDGLVHPQLGILRLFA